MKRKKGDEITLKIDSLVFGGRGVGSLDGWKVFVADTVPGDLVKASLRKIKIKFGEAKLVEVLEPSSLRVEARCKHFDICGGCKWQFLPYEEQLKVKGQQVRDAVERLAEMSDDLVQPILACWEPWFYRNKMELSFADGPEGEVMLGFHPPGYHYEVFDLEECFLQSELLAEIVKKVRDFANEHSLSVFSTHTHEGLLRNLIIREGKNSEGVMVILVTSPDKFDAIEAFKALFEGDSRVSSLFWNVIYQIPGKKTWVEENHLAGKEVLTETMKLEDGSRLEFDIRPQAFFQTNTKQAEVLYSKVVELAGLSGDEVVFDLYCGTGTIGLFCAHAAKEVIGVEMNEAAVESAKSNAEKNRIENISFHLGTVENELAGLKESPDVVIVDPPRSGLGEKVVGLLVEFGAGRVVYVSCNPTTMARDLKLFDELGYKVESVLPIDMFPHTSHVECVSVLGTNILHS